MSDKKPKENNQQSSVFKHSIVWASLILAIAFLLSGKPEFDAVKNTIFILLVGASVISHSILLRSQGKSLISTCEAKLLRRLFK